MVETIRDSQATSATLALAFWRRILWPYAVSILGIVAGLALKLAFASVLRGEASYVLFVPAVLLASALGGWGPGLLATTLGLALGLFFVADARPPATADVMNALVF